MLAVCLRSGHRTVPRLWHVFPKRVKLGPQHTFWCKLVGSLVLWPHHWRRTTGAGARRRCSAPIVTSAPLVGGHKTSEPTSFVASETPSKTTPESYNRTPYARDGRRNTDTQQVGTWGASLPLRAHHEGAPAQTIPRMQRRARVLRAREPNADPPCWHARGPALNNWAPPRKSTGENSLTSDGRRDAEGPRRAPQPSGDARDRAGCAECTSGVARRPRARKGTAAMPRRRLRALLASLGGG